MSLVLFPQMLWSTLWILMQVCLAPSLQHTVPRFLQCDGETHSRPACTAGSRPLPELTVGPCAPGAGSPEKGSGPLADHCSPARQQRRSTRGSGRPECPLRQQQRPERGLERRRGLERAPLVEVARTTTRRPFRSSFSAGSTPIFASNYEFFSIFILEDLKKYLLCPFSFFCG